MSNLNNHSIKIKIQQKKKKPELSVRNKKILSIAKNAFKAALEYFYYPSLPEPNFIFSRSREKGFFIDFDSYQITLNLNNTPNIFLNHELYNYFFSISLHEISHYIFCPYDNLTYIKLLAISLSTGINQKYASIIVNIFIDLVIDKKNHKNFSEIMEWELITTVNCYLKDKNHTQKPSKLWKILIYCYEIIWQIKIIPLNMINEELCAISQKISKVIMQNFHDESLWESKVSKISKLLKKSNKKKDNDSKSNNILPNFLPDDVLNTFGNISQLQNPTLIKKKGETNTIHTDFEYSETIFNALQTNSNIFEYQTIAKILAFYGLYDKIESIAIWYRSNVQVLLNMEIKLDRLSGNLPYYPEIWKIGDKIEDLDPIQTLLTSPLIIPNITTRKWNHFKHEGMDFKKEYPNLMLVIDSSGSMDWKFLKKKIKGKYHLALLAAFAAMNVAISHGNYVSSINFSNKSIIEPWTNNKNKIETNLLSYQGSGTIFPNTAILELAKTTNIHSLVLIISDFEIENYFSIEKTLNKLSLLGHKVIAFFLIDEKSEINKDKLKNFSGTKIQIYFVSKVEDLFGLVISEITKNY